MIHRIKSKRRRHIVLHGTMKFVNTYLKGKNVEVGKHSYSGDDIELPLFYSFVKIGKFCSIAKGLKFVSYGHRTDLISTYPMCLVERGGGDETFKIYDGFTIGNDVYVGTDVVLHGGVVLGDGSVVGAYSVVPPRTKVEPYSIYAGNPAKFIKFRFKKEEIDFLLRLQWWNFPLDKIINLKKTLNSSDVKKLMTMFPNA